MQWNAIVAAVRGEVDASDVVALIAASRPLYTLTQQVADRRLDIELAHPDEAGRVIDYIGPLSAPLWIADNAVAVAQSLCDAEAQAHPQSPARMTRDIHAHALALLGLVEPVLTEVSTALADPSYPMKLRMPLALGLQGGAVGALGYVPLDPVYLRGLMQGSERLQGAAQQAAQECKTLMQSIGAPSWLPRVVPYLDGQLAAADVRLESVRARGAPLLAHQKLSDQALREIISDCWTILDTYAAVGQLATYPRLLPGAPRMEVVPPRPAPAAPARPVAAAPRPTPVPAQYSAPARPPEQPASYTPPPPPEPPRRLPEIASSGAPMAHHTGGAAPLAPTPSHALPDIAPGSGSADPARQPPTAPSRSLPAIGLGSAVPAPAQPPLQQAPPEIAPRALPSIGDASTLAGTPSGTAHTLPQIGPSTPAPATRTPSAAPLDVAPQATMHHAGATRPAARRINVENRWVFSSPEIRQHFRDAGREDEAQMALDVFWQGRDWTLYQDEEDYLLQINDLRQTGAVERAVTGMDGPPFAAIYRVLADKATVRGDAIPVDTLFSYNHKLGHVIIS